MNGAYDRIDLLETFVRIGEARSLSHAARVLGVTQPTASRRLAELEKLVGCRLAVRTSSSFLLTDEGRTLLQEARELTERWSGLADRLQGRASRPEGTLRVIGPAGYGVSFLTDAVTALMAAHPQLQVELRLAEQVPDLAGSGADCWVFVGRIPEQEFVCRTLGTMLRILVATPELLARIGQPTLARLPQLPFVGLDPHMCGEVRLVDARGQERRVRLHTPLRTDSLLSQYRAVLNGAGIGSAAPWMCQPDIDAGRLVRVLPRWTMEPIGIHVALPPGRYRPARVTAFIELLRGRLAREAGFRPAD